MSMNREFAQLEIVYSGPRRSRWFGKSISRFLPEPEPSAASRKQPINWDRVVGLATVLGVMALSWTAMGLVVSHILR